MEVTYIWINPVVEQMYEEYVLDQFLKRHGLNGCGAEPTGDGS